MSTENKNNTLLTIHRIPFYKIETNKIKTEYCFCRFDLSCPILGKDHFIANFYLVCLVLFNSILVFNLVCFNLV